MIDHSIDIDLFLKVMSQALGGEYVSEYRKGFDYVTLPSNWQPLRAGKLSGRKCVVWQIRIHEYGSMGIGVSDFPSTIGKNEDKTIFNVRLNSLSRLYLGTRQHACA